jgi:hypothetical protein
MTELDRCCFAKEKGFTYDPNTGCIRGVRGTLITRKSCYGYIYCSVSYKKAEYRILAHRLAWYLYYGELPKNQVDHIDGDKSNNKIDNLRDVTNQQNQWNRRKAVGYYSINKSTKFMSKIRLNCKNIYLGTFDTAKEARAAYLEAKNKYHGDIGKEFSETIARELEKIKQEGNGKEKN